MNKIITKLIHLTPDTECTISKGITGLAISQPIEMEKMLFRKCTHGYGDTSIDLPFEIIENVGVAECYTHREELIKLGLICFELLFSDHPYVQLNISHKQSQLKQLFLYPQREKHHELTPFLKVDSKETYSAFDYYFSEVDKFPYSGFPGNTREMRDENLPYFSWSCSDTQPHIRWATKQEQLQNADQLILSLSEIGLAHLGSLFFDMGNIHNSQTEVSLENPLYGFGGVDPRSIEARFWLPGSFAFFDAKSVDELVF